MMNMKRFLAAVCAVLCLGLWVLSASAEPDAPGSYTIEESQFSFTFAPEQGWYVLTQDNLEGNRFFDDFEADADEVLAGMQEGNIFLDALYEDCSHELIVSTVHLGFPRSMDFITSESVDKEFDRLFDRDELKANGMTVLDYDLETVGAEKYLVLDFSQESDGDLLYGRQYSTVTNGYLTNFTMISYTGEAPTEAMKAVAKKTVSTAVCTAATDLTVIAVIAGVFLLIVVAAVVIIIVCIKRKRRPAAHYASASPYGQPYAPSAPPMNPYAQPGTPSAPPMNPYAQQPYFPQQGVPAQQSTEQRREAQEHSDHCCACGAPLKPDDLFCNRCGMRR